MQPVTAFQGHQQNDQNKVTASATGGATGDSTASTAAVTLSVRHDQMVSPGKSERVLEYAGKIREHGRNAVDAVLAIAQLCAAANESLSALEKEELLKELALSASSFSKFVKIADDSRLKGTEIQQKLPLGWTVLYELALLKSDDFDDANAEGIIHPEMTRATLKKWLGSRQALAATSTVRGPETAVATSVLGASEKNPISPEHREPSAVQNLDNIPPFLDRRSLSPEEERELDAIETAYNAACQLVQERFWTIHCRSPSQ
jgi:hypothetical protein